MCKSGLLKSPEILGVVFLLAEGRVEDSLHTFLFDFYRYPPYAIISGVTASPQRDAITAPAPMVGSLLEACKPCFS